MKVTRITQKNVQYFRPLMPDQFLNDKNLLHLGAVSDDDEACAAMSVGVVGPMAYVRWLYTATGLRGQGAATALMDAVTGLISQMNLDGIEIDFDEAEAEDLDSFLTDYGFLVADDRDVYSVPVADVVYGAAIEQLGETELHAGGMHGVSDEAVRGRLIEYVERNGMNPEYLTRLSDEFSVVGTDGDGEVICCILILSFYSVVGGWGIEYLFKSVRFDFTRGTGEDLSTLFSDFSTKLQISIALDKCRDLNKFSIRTDRRVHLLTPFCNY